MCMYLYSFQTSLNILQKINVLDNNEKKNNNNNKSEEKAQTVHTNIH